MAAHVIFVLLLTLHVSNASNILMLFPVDSYSHTILALRLADGLSDKGHNVTFISPYTIETNKFNHIVIKGLLEKLGKYKISIHNNIFFGAKSCY